MFFQEAPRDVNLLHADVALKNAIDALSPEILDAERDAFETLGRATEEELPTLANAAEAQPPEHVPYGPFGKRIDLLKTSPAWKALKDFSAQHRIIAAGYDPKLKEHARLVEAMRFYLFSASSATFACPLAMTDAAAQVLLKDAPDSLREKWLPRLLSTDVETFVTSGQWMTERTGGSDVGQSETRAIPLEQKGDQDTYALHGVKWFTSATTSEMALALARIDDGETKVAGSRGLTLFLVEIQRDDEGLKGIEVNRLKDKLGTRALPTAELTLNGVVGVRVGEVGRGIPTVSAMLNITRWLNATASASNMARGVARAKDYATRRKAFGKALIEHPLHARTLAQLEAIKSGAMSLSFEIARLLGKSEHGLANESEERQLRAMIPLAKLTLGKQAVAVAAECIECFGGAGYVEDTGLPTLLREAHVFPIWEGTTNVLSLDVLRAEARGACLSEVLRSVQQACEKLTAPEANAPLLERLQRVKAVMKSLAAESNANRERRARDIALSTGELLQGLLLAQSAQRGEPGAEQLRNDFYDACLCSRV